MSDNAPFPATASNIIAGSLFTLLWFVASVSVITSLFFLGSNLMFIAFIYAFVLSAVFGLIGVTVLGAPLALLVNRLLRGTSSVLAHALATLAAGAVTGAIVSTAIGLLLAGSNSVYFWYGLALTLVTALCSVAGWFSALRRSRPKARTPRYDPFTATDLP